MKNEHMNPKLALMTFSMMGHRIKGQLNAKSLCQLAKVNNVPVLDMMEIEVKLYGEKKLLSAMQETGIQMGCLITTVNFYTQPQKVEKQLLSALSMADRFGAKILMVVPGSPMDEKVCKALSSQQMLDIAVKNYTKAVELAKPYGIRVGFENTPQHFKPLASAEDCLYVLEHVAGLGFIFDTGNVKILGREADELAYYEKVKPYLLRVHLKDVVIGKFTNGERCIDGLDIKAVMSGSGSVKISEVISNLRHDNYDGYMAIEYAAVEIPPSQNSVMVGAYCSYIRNSWDDSLICPPYTQIDGIDKNVSRLFFGTAIPPMLMGKNCNVLLDSMYAQGVNAFDCARGYGMAEKSLGAWIKERGNREQIVLLTKCGNAGFNGKVHIDREVIEKELDTSLKTLETDYVDIFLLHRDDPNTPVSEIIDCLNECKQQGKVRVFGASNWTHQRIAEANAYAQSKGLQGFTVSSPNFGLAEQVEDPWGGSCVTISGNVNREAREWYTESQMPVLAYSSLARGFFSGRFRSFDYDGAKKVLDGAGQKGYLYPVNMERLKRAEKLAAEKGCTVAQIAMRYIFANQMNMFALVSTQNPARMRENIEASRNPLTAQEAAWLENGEQQEGEI